MTAEREKHIHHFYDLLADLEERVGGKRVLNECNGRMGWPRRGLYFFFEDGEFRCGSDTDLRVVRVGTHALRLGAKSTLWGRLKQHQGVLKHGGGNRGSSIFRYHVGLAIANRDKISIPDTWRKGVSDCDLEREVSKHIRNMPFLWVNVDDAAGPGSDRGIIERSTIAMLSAKQSTATDRSSKGWLGLHSDQPEIRGSGLWNVMHVDDKYDPSFLDVLKRRIERTSPL